jgi:hypothetical protein
MRKIPSEPWTNTKLRSYVGDCNGPHHFRREANGHRADEIPDNETGARFLKQLESYFDAAVARFNAGLSAEDHERVNARLQLVRHRSGR